MIVTDNRDATRPLVSGAGERRWRPSAIGWLAVAVVAALPVAEALRIVVQRSAVVLDGDEALLDLGARRAGHFLQLVGPYSRVGFHQPGPAVFYLLAPFVRILGSNGPGLFLGAITISGAALVATVAFLWRIVGPVAALWAAVAIDCYCLCLRVGTLREPWNPYLVVTPMVLFVVLWAAGITGRRGAGLWAAVIGSFEVQTHIATAGFVVVMSVILVARMVWATRQGKDLAQRRSELRGWGPARATGTVALMLIWLPPIVEAWRDHPNNASVLWDYFTAGHTPPTLHQALEVTANALTIMPFGYHDYVLALTRSPAQLGIGAALIVIGTIVAITLGRRRRQPLALALAGASILGIVLGAVSMLLAAAPLYLYFAVWLAFVPLALMMAIGIALFAPSGPPQPPSRSWFAGLAGLAVVAVTLAAATVVSDLSMAPVQTSAGAGPWPQAVDSSLKSRSRAVADTAALSAAAQSVLRPSDRWVNFDLDATSPWPYVAGMVLALDERGVQSTVSPASWDLYFGHERAPGHPTSVGFELYAATDPQVERNAGATTIAVVDGYVLAYRRHS